VLGALPSSLQTKPTETESQAVFWHKENMMKKFLWGACAVIALGVFVTQLAPKFMGLLGGKTLTAEEKSSCGLSVSVTEGPYFVSGTAALANNNLNFSNLPGTPIQISGHVYEGLDNLKPVANAKIEIWHTDTSGSYHPNNNGPITSYKSEDIALRGFITTDASGAYSFTTVYPGEYSGRTRHIHFKITTPAKSLTTQLIIPALNGDKLTFDEDTIAQGLPNCALLKLDTSAKPETANFDFRL
jgi:protocatechuate 3,4-dioxygenase beta subunit